VVFVASEYAAPQGGVDLTHQRLIFSETLVARCRLTGSEEALISFPFGLGDLEAHRRTQGEYPVVARAAG